MREVGARPQVIVISRGPSCVFFEQMMQNYLMVEVAAVKNLRPWH